jgi:hypothetical protein
VLVGCGAAVLLVGLASSGNWARRTADRVWGQGEPRELPQPTGG